MSCDFLGDRSYRRKSKRLKRYGELPKSHNKIPGRRKLRVADHMITRESSNVHCSDLSHADDHRCTYCETAQGIACGSDLSQRLSWDYK
jgi:hypothetical protein